MGLKEMGIKLGPISDIVEQKPKENKDMAFKCSISIDPSRLEPISQNQIDDIFDKIISACADFTKKGEKYDRPRGDYLTGEEKEPFIRLYESFRHIWPLDTVNHKTIAELFRSVYTKLDPINDCPFLVYGYYQYRDQGGMGLIVNDVNKTPYPNTVPFQITALARDNCVTIILSIRTEKRSIKMQEEIKNLS